MFNRDRNFKVRNDFTIAKDFQRFKGLDVTVMKVFRWVEKQLYAGPDQLSLPFYSQFTLRICTATNGLGGTQKLTSPRAQEPLGSPLKITMVRKANWYEP